MHGRAVRDHLRVEDMPVADFLDVLWSYRVDDEVAAAVTPTGDGERLQLQTRGAARERLTGSATDRPGAAAAPPPPPSIDDADRDTWGLLPEHQAGGRALMLFAGPPAPPRQAPP